MPASSGHILTLTEIDGLIVAEFSGEDEAIVYDPAECSVSVVRLEQDTASSGIPPSPAGAGPIDTLTP